MNEDLLKEYVALLVEKIKTRKGVRSRLGSKFNLNTFRTLDNINSFAEYAKTYLEILGWGSSRIAFALTGRYVLKVAHNEKGISQNKTELDVYTNPKSKMVVTKIQSADDQYRWLISEVVKPLSSESEFEELTGIDWERFTDILHDYVKRRQNVPNDLPKFAKAVIFTALNNKLVTGDLDEISHWGKTPDGRCVLLDYGLSNEVWDTHYKTKPVATNTEDSDKTSPALPAAKR